MIPTDETELQEWADNAMVRKRVICPHCHNRVVPRGPSRLWRIALPFAYLITLVALVASSLMVMGMVLALPIVLAMGAGTVAMHIYSRRNPICPSCGNELPRKDLPLLETDATVAEG